MRYNGWLACLTGTIKTVRVFDHYFRTCATSNLGLEDFHNEGKGLEECDTRYILAGREADGKN